MHHLYTGVTESGKTTLARMNARSLQAAKIPVVVYDPLGTSTAGGDWGKDARIFHETDSFMDLMHDPNFKNTAVFVDEAHHIFSHEQKENLWLLTQGRHYGMNFHLLTQRPKKIHPDARTGCARCFMFRLAQDDASEIGKDYGHSFIHKINLDRGDFLVLNSGSAEFSRANVFDLINPKGNQNARTEKVR
jgi:DNA helicase HerA-like ATPase